MKNIQKKILYLGILCLASCLGKVGAIALINNTQYKMFLVAKYKNNSQVDCIDLTKNKAEIIEFVKESDLDGLFLQVWVQSNKFILFNFPKKLSDSTIYLSLTPKAPEKDKMWSPLLHLSNVLHDANGMYIPAIRLEKMLPVKAKK